MTESDEVIVTSLNKVSQEKNQIRHFLAILKASKNLLVFGRFGSKNHYFYSEMPKIDLRVVLCNVWKCQSLLHLAFVIYHLQSATSYILAVLLIKTIQKLRWHLRGRGWITRLASNPVNSYYEIWPRLYVMVFVHINQSTNKKSGLV